MPLKESELLRLKAKRATFLLETSPAAVARVTHEDDAVGLLPYSSSPRRPRRTRRRGVAFFLHSGQGEIMLSVLAAGAVAPVGTIHSSTLRSERQPPSSVTIRPASIPRVFTR